MFLSPELESFISVVRHGGFTAAARDTFISQSSLTRRVKALESQLGVELLHRSGSGIALTDAGRLLYDRSEGLLATAESIRQELSGDDYKRESLKLAMITRHRFDLFTNISLEFSKTHANVRVTFKPSSVPSCFDELLRDEVDAFISYNIGTALSRYPQAAHTEVLLDRMAIGAPRGDPILEHGELHADDFAGRLVYMAAPGMFGGDYDRLRDEIIRLDNPATVRDTTFESTLYVQAAMEGALVAGAEHYIECNSSHAVLDDSYRMSAYVFHARECSETVRSFIMYVKRKLAESSG